jgi:hypothetical protein
LQGADAAAVARAEFSQRENCHHSTATAFLKPL